jgi:hypothetical protein
MPFCCLGFYHHDLFSGCSKAPTPDSPNVETDKTPVVETMPVDNIVVRDTEQERKRQIKQTTEEKRKMPPTAGTVAALRADAIERNPRQKQRIDNLIKKRYRATQNQSYSIVVITDGSTFTAKDMKETDEGYTMQAAMNAKRTVFSPKLLKKSEVASIETECGDKAMWLRVKRARPPATAMDSYRHDRMITLIFDYFLEEFPDSEYAENVSAIRDMWVNEKKQLDDVWIKVKGKWYGPDEIPPKTLPKSSQQTIAAVKNRIVNGQYFEAATLYGDIKIPPGFKKEQKAVEGIRRQIEEGLDHQLNQYVRSVNKEKADAKSKYERELVKISTWRRSKKSTVWNRRAESEYRYQQRLAGLRYEAEMQLQARQNTARNKARNEYEKIAREADYKLSEKKDEVQRARTAISVSSL